jgi:DnaJ-class molecular chaperone
MSVSGDFYAELGVDKGASSEQIKKAFRKLARTCHPDVAKDDPSAAEKFARIREAYETLVDPQRRDRYDRRGQRRKINRGAEWRPPGGWGGFSTRSRTSRAKRQPEMDLEDIFTERAEASDFGFGGRGRQGPGGKAPDKADKGRTIEVTVNTPSKVARLGGTVTVRYPRMRRSSDGVNVYRYNEIYDLRVPPRTCTGDVLTVDRMGDSGGSSGRYGDLICKISVVSEAPRAKSVKAKATQGSSPSPEPPPPEPPPPPPPPPPQSRPDIHASGQTRIISISIAEAVLGGRFEVPTAQGPVRLSIPPGSSSGTRLRLKGRGPSGGDIFVVLRIAVPRELDEESRELIARFAELNPGDPRDDG